MKLMMVFTVGVCLLFAPMPVAADQAADEAAIRKLLDEFPAHYNKHDAKALLPYLDEEVEFFGDSWKSHADAQKGYEGIFQRQKGIKAKQGDRSVVFVTPDVALAKVPVEYSGRVDADGKAIAPSSSIVVVVLVKKGGSWLIRAIYEKSAEE